jgi:Small primase-like proteins (Toprim domain)
MYKIKEAIVVEGRYDKNTLSQLVDATIIETSGFSIFSDREKLELLRRLAEKRGIIILTDGDGAGFMIRGYLKGAIPTENVKHAYIPDIKGKERRKRTASKEGKLGVEGMKGEILLEALRRAGATFEDETAGETAHGGITKADMYSMGLSGTDSSAVRRRALASKLGLPERISAGVLLDVLNALYSRDELRSLLTHFLQE